MRVCRLDLGAEVVHVPSRDLLVIHPDLDYAEALGAVAGTLPHLHPDTVVSLVEQVTPRPRRERRGVRLANLALAVAAALLAVVGALASTGTAVADTRWGPAWRARMAALGMRCTQRDVGTEVCLDRRKQVTEVHGYRRSDSALYMLTRQGQQPRFMLIFKTAVAAARYQAAHPNVRMAGRVAVW